MHFALLSSVQKVMIVVWILGTGMITNIQSMLPSHFEFRDRTQSTAGAAD